MQRASNTCKSVFKNGVINKEAYIALWVTLLERLAQELPTEAGRAGDT